MCVCVCVCVFPIIISHPLLIHFLLLFVLALRSSSYSHSLILQLVDEGDEEIISNLHKQVTSHQQLAMNDAITGIEAAARRLPEEEANDLRVGILRRTLPPKRNITREHKKALRDLREMKDEIILPADKGNATVVMTKADNQ